MSKYKPQTQTQRQTREASLAEARRREAAAQAEAKRKQLNILVTVSGVVLILTLLIIMIVFASGNKSGSAPKMEDLDFSAVNLSDVQPATGETNYVKMTIRERGDVIIRLFPNVAPITVANFKELVGSGFYNGLTFHRIMDNFMAQGGDPKGDGTGGSSKTIKGEFSANGVENNLSHVKGVVSMARGGRDMNSASSQFFITFSDRYKTSLDGSYAAFGYVCAGQDVVDALQTVERTLNSSGEMASPVEPVIIDSMSFVTVAGSRGDVKANLTKNLTPFILCGAGMALVAVGMVVYFIKSKKASAR